MHKYMLSYRKLVTSVAIGMMIIAFLTSSTVIAPTPPTNWWNTDWRYRKSLTIDHTKVASDLTDFPVLVSLTDADLAAKAQIYGEDIAFANYTGQKLYHEIEYYNGTSGTLIAWVRVPNLSSTSDTVIYMYYGNPEALDQTDSEQTWDSNYMMTQHFNQRYESVECRFWGMIAQDVLPQTVVLDQLINLPNSLKNLGATNPDGWGLAYYNSSIPTIRNGEPAANTDPNFNVAAQELASNNATIGIGHVRKSASPPYNVPDPHPFNRTKLGKTWTFAHHGVIDKSVLVELIGDAYLADNPPQYGSSISDWNDSELYFIYVLKCVEEMLGNVTKGVARAVTTISAKSSSYNMNFVFSDGLTLWAFRRGDTTHNVYYYYNSTYPQYTAVASQYPSSTQGSWVFMNNYNFVELTRTNPPLVIEDIRESATIDHFDSTSNNNYGLSHGGVVISAQGKINGGDLFDGVDDYVSMNDSSTLHGNGTWTQLSIELWVKPDSAAPSAQRMIRKGPSSGTGVNSYQVGFQTTGSLLYFDVWPPGSAANGYYEVQYNTLLTAGTWYHVVCVYEAGVGSKIYVNGIDVNATRVGSTGDPTKNVSGSVGQPLYIGCRWSGAYPTGNPANFFDGTLDEVRISNATRSSQWIFTSFANQNDPSSFYAVGTEEVGIPTTIQINPEAAEVFLGSDCTVYVEVLEAVDLYAWEFRLDYNATILDLTSCSIVAGGLNEPNYTYYNMTDAVNGRIWWAFSTVGPTLTGISYSQHAIFEIHYHTKTIGTSGLNLSGTILCDSNGDSIAHEVVNGSITVTGAVDLLIENMEVLDLGCSVYANDTYVNGTTYYYPVEVTLRNNGTIPADPFYVRLEIFWINGSITETSKEEYVSGLATGTSVVVNFTDAFSPAHTRYYRLTATVDSKNNVTESDETNNAFILDNVKVTVMGDVNSDGVVNILDGVTVSLAWNGYPSDPQWNIQADVNHDGHVDIFDGTRLGLHWSQTW